jgi:hypothetical protein
MINICIILSITNSLFSQNDGVWRVLERNSYYDGYDFDGIDWIHTQSYTKETPYYMVSHTDVIDSIYAKHRTVNNGIDSGWNHWNTVHFNPSIIQTPEGKSVTYNICVNQSDAMLYWNGRYDTQNRLVEYNAIRNYSATNLVTTHVIYYYNSRNEPDSTYKYTYNNYSFGQYQKTVNVYDSLGKKTTELVYTSSSPLSWQLTKRIHLYYSPDMYPDDYYFKTQNPMFLQRLGTFPGSLLDNNFSGLTTPYLADSLCIQVLQDSVWVDQEYDYYSINFYNPNNPQIDIEQWETQFIPPPPDFQPPGYTLVFNSYGFLISERYHIDNIFSPFTTCGTSYTWDYYVSNNDNTIPSIPELILRQNYPNPFSKSTAINFSNHKSSVISLKIYNVRGQLVKTLCERISFKSGEHTINWDGTDSLGKRLASGLYVFKLSNDKEIQVRKLLLLN